MPPDEGLVASVFGDRAPRVMRYVELLSGDGVQRGLIGPRETPRLWERHVFNCALVAPLFGRPATVADVGSGAGLPGIVIALARPDLDVTLIEPLLRRSAFLHDVRDELDLSNVAVYRGRAEEAARAGQTYDAVTARAVAPLARLAGWCLPLCRTGGEMVALKGRSAEDELAGARDAVARFGGRRARVQELRRSPEDDPTYAIRIESSGSRPRS